MNKGLRSMPVPATLSPWLWRQGGPGCKLTLGWQIRRAPGRYEKGYCL